MMPTDLPEGLRDAVLQELKGMPAKRLSALSQALSQQYRHETTRPTLSGGDLMAYVAVRLPATFAAVSAALAQVQAQMPGFAPNSVLDVGAGPGTATWAALTLWSTLQSAELLESDDRMIALGRRLAESAGVPLVHGAHWRQVDVTSATYGRPSDLVVASYMLGELPSAALAGVFERLWQASGEVLVLIEPGTPAGFARIRQARTQLIAAGAKTIAPCPHDATCPMAAGDWCHFSQRVTRSRLHRAAKAGALGYEDEKFSFVAMGRRAPPLPIAGRVLRHPRIDKGRVRLEVCMPKGLRSLLITRKQGGRYSDARKLAWGSPLPWRDQEEDS